MSQKKTFLLGVGAQKTGTTWLYRYLLVQRNFINHVKTAEYDGELPYYRWKEFHIWDAIDQMANFKVSKDQRDKSTIDRQRWDMQNDTSLYFEYFNDLLNRSACNLTADITPSYSSLPIKSFEAIRDGFLKYDIECKVIFLMRDPVERLWSAVRSNRRRKLKAENKTNVNTTEEADLLEDLIRPRVELRSNYIRTVERLEQVFEKEQLYFGFYETLFTKESITSLSNFLGIKPDLEFADIAFNVSNKRTYINEQTLAAVAKHNSHIYNWCEKRFPITKTLWHGYSYLD